MTVFIQTIRRRVSVSLIAVSLIGSGPWGAAFALTATNVKCKGCVGTEDIKKGAVAGEHIKNKSIGKSRLAPDSVKTAKLKTGAVTGPKLELGLSGLSNVILVGSGGEYANPRDAMASITDAGPGNRYVLILAPGVFNLGTNSLQMKEWVDIRGSGANITRITGTPPTASGDAGVVRGADHARIQALTVINNSTGSDAGRAAAILNQGVSPTLSHLKAIGASSYGVGILNTDAAAPAIYDVIAEATGTEGEGIRNVNAAPRIRTCELSGFRHGLRNESGSAPDVADTIIIATAGTGDAIRNAGGSHATLINVIAMSDDDAIRNFSSDPTIRNVIAQGGASGVKSTSSSPQIHESRLVGGSAGFGLETVSGSPKVINSQIVGGVNGTATCVKTYDGDFNALSCP